MGKHPGRNCDHAGALLAYNRLLGAVRRGGHEIRARTARKPFEPDQRRVVTPPGVVGGRLRREAGTMHRIDTLRECFRHNDWARDKLLGLSQGLSDEQLDRPFEMGPGSQRATLRHLCGAERVWLERWRGAEQPQFPRSRTIDAIDDLWRAFRDLATARNADLATLADDELQRPVSYTDQDGQTHANPLADILLHVCNHGVHHRAQALNMLRQLGLKVPGLGYLFMKCERPTLRLERQTIETLKEMGFDVKQTPEPPAAYDLDTIRVYYRYGEWAFRRVVASASSLTDDQLDRSFEIGLGSLRKTLLHIRDAEQYWLDNWTKGSTPGIEELPITTSIDELAALFEQTAEGRSTFLGRQSSDDLQRPITVQPALGKKLAFRLGEAVLQVCCHGTHHRAQALNMLRQIDAEVPALDYVVWRSEKA